MSWWSHLIADAGYKTFLSVVIVLLCMVAWGVVDSLTRRDRGMVHELPGCGCAFLLVLCIIIGAVWVG